MKPEDCRKELEDALASEEAEYRKQLTEHLSGKVDRYTTNLRLIKGDLRMKDKAKIIREKYGTEIFDQIERELLGKFRANWPGAWTRPDV